MTTGIIWHLHAHEYENGHLFNVGPEPWVRLHGLPDPVVAVVVTEVAAADPAGTHWGWLWADRDNWAGGAPCMIWPHRGQFDMQFPYGAKAEEEAGRGRVVRLRIETVRDMLAREGAGAEARAEAEERGEIAPMPGYRARPQ